MGIVAIPSVAPSGPSPGSGRIGAVSVLQAPRPGHRHPQAAQPVTTHEASPLARMMRSPGRQREHTSGQTGCRPADTSRVATLLSVSIAVILFDFDPYAHLFGDLAVRWGGSP